MMTAGLPPKHALGHVAAIAIAAWAGTANLDPRHAPSPSKPDLIADPLARLSGAAR